MEGKCEEIIEGILQEAKLVKLEINFSFLNRTVCIFSIKEVFLVPVKIKVASLNPISVITSSSMGPSQKGCAGRGDSFPLSTQHLEGPES